ncbi:1,3-beta-glucanosyltransferase gel2 [Aspergillus nomiae NRRL 13137]|uniref:1,3-beta-glucanosyltransferase n=1 Tax=Aspergillus nomiae NRRL (strain ATCC 15546 / NRRL 13137 / CBS 260.88 / M93) TaxID=1509407 RepID=A0A0L1IYH7_ASPN3|nr:1,3-beta-glucanosyltransferase gel2 [Aspergillus nomiae NRRL 13137]KNG84440.1 1,3-beta-glucanosyltransferase gel2 [Aspergillus nomiae NRRL 13137]
MYTRLFAALCALATTANAVTTIEVKGKDFVNSKTGDRFQILGVDYQPGGSSGFKKDKDPLSDKDACLRDAALMQRLGVNTIRVYNLAPSLNHDDCASIFNAAGIYMILDVNSPLYGSYIDRTAPKSSYNAVYYEQVFGVIEAFKNYPNTLGFFAGNEVINEQSVKEVAAYIRAVQRDMKDYIKKNVDRSIPVGYSAADIRPWLMDTLNYFMCEDSDSPSSQSDFFGLNSYSWCGDSSYTKSGYDYGCNEVTPRVFTEVQAIYGEEMTQAFSGGLVYEYTQEANNYGLVKLNDSDTATLLVDFENLQKQYAKLDMKRIQASNSTQTSFKAPKCSSDLIKNGTFLSKFDLPSRPSKVQDMIDNGLSKANTGKLVEVSTTSIPQKIYDHAGKEVTGIQLKALSSGESNTPSTSGSSSSDSDSNNTKESAAGKMTASFMGLVVGAVVAAVSVL